ncbi:alpha/beta hydrolase [Amycolatopsis sp. WAC 01375]|uniref:alpha/beta fold hydrolase n=1 Tax=Amycolatopsis sp. WAC 01375 TaxID=2203194 RepID=UPI000F79A652|nr:alpha/beta fold hydrolase [Amycolatopsis sp. WAC 01375]RSM69307.1 alpha/beta hydrolase [Amycolatopsis sp. WAC 01375]
MTDSFAGLPGGPKICYREDGPADGVPLVLIAGLGLDLTSWPRPMIEGFTGRGFRVIRFDNRDAGCSDRIKAPNPGKLRQLLARPLPGAYDLGDMAADTIGLLDHLGVEQAHLVGMSMGGMIAQTVAARNPCRVLSLTSIFSTTGHRRVGQPARSTLLRMARRPARTAEESVTGHLAMMGHLGSATFPLDKDVETAWATALWERAGGRRARSGIARQIGAIQASGDRTAELARITCPTVVVHGDTDRMVHRSGGRATAKAIAGARYVEIPGMGHHIAPDLVERLVELTAELALDPAGETR